MPKIGNYITKHYEVLDSTQEEAKRLIKGGEAIEGQVLIAKQQTDAHGKLNAIWEGSKCDIAMTLIVRPEIETNLRGQICYIAALAVAKSLQQLSSVIDVKLKWVNDVLINNRKVCGILLEQMQYGFTLVGIGVNLNDSPHLKKYNATSLEAEKVPFEYEKLIEDIIKNFIGFYNEWMDRGFLPIKTQWLRYAKGLNSNLKVRLPNKVIEGIFINIDDDGSLLLVQDSQVISIAAGEVFFNEEKNIWYF